MSEKTKKLNQMLNPWLHSFKKSSYYKELDPFEKNFALIVVKNYAQAMLLDYDRLPRRWTKRETILAVKKMLKNYENDDDHLYSVIPCLGTFFLFLDSQGELKNSDALINGLMDVEEKVLGINYSDLPIEVLEEEALAFAKEMGLTFADAQEVHDYLSFFIANIDQLDEIRAGIEAMRQLEPKQAKKKMTKPQSDPNLLCPCGSGKYFKECCGRFDNVIAFPSQSKR